MDKITVWGPDYSNYVRCVLLCCAEKGVEYELKVPGKSLLSMNPFKKVPVVEHNGLVIYETPAICRYLDRVFDGADLSPNDPVQLAWMDRWISAANCYFDSAIIRRYVLEYAFPKGPQDEVRMDVVKEAEAQIKNYLAIMDDGLGQYEYFSGNKPGIADYLIVPMLDYLSNGVVPTNLIEMFPAVNTYLLKMRMRDSGRRYLGMPGAKVA